MICRKYLPLTFTAMFAIHMAIEIAETILFLFQMAILSNIHERIDLGGSSYYRNSLTSEEQLTVKNLQSQRRKISRKKIYRCGALRPGHIKLMEGGAYGSKSDLKLGKIINQNV
jgi:hypothetical protein